MTLDEAILHCEEVADRCCDIHCEADHRQLAEWLEELKVRRVLEGDLSAIKINGEWYLASHPVLKSEHKDGECVIGGFRRVDV